MRYAARERTLRLYEMVSNKDPFTRDDFWMEFNQFGNEFVTKRMRFMALPLTADEKAMLKNQRKLSNITVPFQKKVVELVNEDRLDEAVDLLEKKVMPNQKKVLQEIDKLYKFQEVESEAKKALAVQEYELARSQMIVSGAAALVLGFAIMLFTSRRVLISERALRKEKERAWVTLNSIADGVIITDPKGIVEFMNPESEALTGWLAHHGVGRSINEVFPLVKDDVENIGKEFFPVDVLLSNKETLTIFNGLTLLNQNGSDCSVELMASPMFDEDRNVNGVVLTFRDISQGQQKSQSSKLRTIRDELSGLLNRRALCSQLDDLVASNLAEADCIFVLMTVQNIVEIREKAGEIASGEYIKMISSRLVLELPQVQDIARVSEGSFAFLVKNSSIDAVYSLVSKVQQILSDQQFSWNGYIFKADLRSGLAELNNDLNTTNKIFHAVEMASLDAVNKGKSGVEVYNRHQGDDRRKDEGDWNQIILSALDDDRFYIEIHPIVPSAGFDFMFSRAEILLRMSGRNGEQLLPGAFIPAAERYNLMPLIDRWVVNQAFVKLRTALIGQRSLMQLVSINLSIQSMRDESFLSFLVGLNDAHGIPPERVCFEAKESDVITNLGVARQFIRDIRSLGFRFALDDFGTAMGSLSYLNNLPVDYIKIDGKLISSMFKNKINYSFIEFIVRASEQMGKKTIAEYVENEKTAEALLKMGVHFLQGWHYSKPISTDSLFSGGDLTENSA
ncbi:MAG: EAL domain-containing protein, partial [Gammaproteobacteria bacterium]|nr:EAL domain-containing protein [Gammaproteobacteria bacterium]